MISKRVFNGKDADMLSRVVPAMNSFKNKMADFTAFDPGLNNVFYNEWKAAFDKLIDYYDMDKFEVHDQTRLLKEANTALAACREKYLEVKYFAGRAFPRNKEVLREFGEGSFSRLRHNHLQMVQFMETLHGVATKYKTELIAKNYTQAAIDQIATLTATLRADNGKQQMQKKERPSETRKRIEALNTFYGFGKTVSEAARKIYFNNEIFRDQFRLGVRHHNRVKGTWMNIGAGEVRKIALPKLLKKFSVTLTNQSKETLQYWWADSIRQTPADKHPLAAGEQITVSNETPAKKFMLLQNTANKAVKAVLKKTPKQKK